MAYQPYAFNDGNQAFSMSFLMQETLATHRYDYAAIQNHICVVTMWTVHTAINL